MILLIIRLPLSNTYITHFPMTNPLLKYIVFLEDPRNAESIENTIMVPVTSVLDRLIWQRLTQLTRRTIDVRNYIKSLLLCCVVWRKEPVGSENVKMLVIVTFKSRNSRMSETDIQIRRFDSQSPLIFVLLFTTFIKYMNCNNELPENIIKNSGIPTDG